MSGQMSDMGEQQRTKKLPPQHVHYAYSFVHKCFQLKELFTPKKEILFDTKL